MLETFAAPGHWYRGNVHIHSTESDGKFTPAKTVDWYKARGYDFIAITDHRRTTDTSAFNTPDFLLIPGIELDCTDPERAASYHVVGIGMTDPLQPDPATKRGPGQALIDAIKAHGGEAIVAHPYWLGLSPDDVFCLQGALGLEVFNATCRNNCKPDSPYLWDLALDRKRQMLGFAVDDAHRYEEDAGAGWIMVKAPELTQSAIMAAIRNGHFYASQGPQIIDVRVISDQVQVRTSPAKEIHFVSNKWRGKLVMAKPGELLTSASCPLYKDGYLRIECVDAEGNMAWTQAEFLGNK